MNRYQGNSTRDAAILSLFLVVLMGLSATQGAAQNLNDQLPIYLVRFDEFLLTTAVRPPATLPIAAVPQPGVPTIDVYPDKLDVVQRPDTVMTYTLNIDNDGSADLIWSIDEANSPAAGFSPEAHPWRGESSMIEGGLGLSDVAGKVPGVAPQAPNVFIKVIWDQPTSGAWGGISDYWSTQSKGAYSANDFVLSQPETISLIFVDGFDLDNQLADQPAITWMIYPDGGGAPAGHPEDGGGTEIWSYTAAPGDPGVDITNDAISLDLVAASQPLVSLPSGTYWLTVYPTYTNPQWRWNWYMASPLGYKAQLIDPTDDILGRGFTSWTPWTSAHDHIVDLAFRLEGPSICNQPSSIPWASVSPTGGSTGPGGSSPVEVTLDPTGLPIGRYTGSLCVNSNDPSAPVVEVPLSLTVAIAPDLQIDKDDGGLIVAPGDTLAYTLTYNNAGYPATGVVITDTVPANTTFNPGASTAGWSCAPDNSAGSICTLVAGNVSFGGGGSAGFVVTVNSSIPSPVSTIDNTVEIGDDGSNGPDTNPDDNLDSVTTQLIRRILIPIITK